MLPTTCAQPSTTVGQSPSPSGHSTLTAGHVPSASTRSSSFKTAERAGGRDRHGPDAHLLVGPGRLRPSSHRGQGRRPGRRRALIPFTKDLSRSLLRIGFRNIHFFIHHQSENFVQGMPTEPWPPDRRPPGHLQVPREGARRGLVGQRRDVELLRRPRAPAPTPSARAPAPLIDPKVIACSTRPRRPRAGLAGDGASVHEEHRHRLPVRRRSGVPSRPPRTPRRSPGRSRPGPRPRAHAQYPRERPQARPQATGPRGPGSSQTAASRRRAIPRGPSRSSCSTPATQTQKSCSRSTSRTTSRGPRAAQSSAPRVRCVRGSEPIGGLQITFGRFTLELGPSAPIVPESATSTYSGPVSPLPPSQPSHRFTQR